MMMMMMVLNELQEMSQNEQVEDCGEHGSCSCQPSHQGMEADNVCFF